MKMISRNGNTTRNDQQHIIVDHQEQSEENVSTSSCPSSCSKSSNKPSRFPESLMLMISDKYNISALRWMEDGLSFTIVDKKQLETEVLGKYFRSVRYPSFRRKLNRWGFKLKQDECFTESATQTVYFHEFFRRDSPLLLQNMKTGGKELPIDKIESQLFVDDISTVTFNDDYNFEKSNKKRHYIEDNEVTPIVATKRKRTEMVDFNLIETHQQQNKHVDHQVLSPPRISRIFTDSVVSDDFSNNNMNLYKSMLRISELCSNNRDDPEYQNDQAHQHNHFIPQMSKSDQDCYSLTQVSQDNYHQQQRPIFTSPVHVYRRHRHSLNDERYHTFNNQPSTFLNTNQIEYGHGYHNKNYAFEAQQDAKSKQRTPRFQNLENAHHMFRRINY